MSLVETKVTVSVLATGVATVVASNLIVSEHQSKTASMAMAASVDLRFQALVHQSAQALTARVDILTPALVVASAEIDTIVDPLALAMVVVVVVASEEIIAPDMEVDLFAPAMVDLRVPAMVDLLATAMVVL